MSGDGSRSFHSHNSVNGEVYVNYGAKMRAKKGNKGQKPKYRYFQELRPSATGKSKKSVNKNITGFIGITF